MARYIGKDIAYGLFEKQEIIVPAVNPPSVYDLRYSISSPNALLVVCERAVLEPGVDYTVFVENGQHKLQLHGIDLTSPGDDARVSLYVVYLGKELLVPASADVNRILELENNSATKEYVDQKVADLVNGSPETLNTLNELANALGQDANFATTVANTIGSLDTRLNSVETSLSNVSVENVLQSFDSTITPGGGVFTIDLFLGKVVLGTLSESVNTWSIVNVPTENGKAVSVTVILNGNSLYTYGDACSVNGVSVDSGVTWIGGAPAVATNNTDIITFVIIRDNSGTVKVFGSTVLNLS